MKSISLWQPWASLIFTGNKKFETRHWATFYRGPLAIHAAQKLVGDLDVDLRRLVIDCFGLDWRTTLPRGRMIGTANLIDCKHTEAFDVDAIERVCGNWEPGRFAWRLDGYQKFAFPPAVKGRQGFFDWHDPSFVLPEPEPARLLVIVVRVELHSAVTGKVTEIARAHIYNTGGTDKWRDYGVRTLRGRDSTALDQHRIQREGRIMGHASLALHVWHLVAKALESMGYGK